MPARPMVLGKRAEGGKLPQRLCLIAAKIVEAAIARKPLPKYFKRVFLELEYRITIDASLPIKSFAGRREAFQIKLQFRGARNLLDAQVHWIAIAAATGIVRTPLLLRVRRRRPE